MNKTMLMEKIKSEGIYMAPDKNYKAKELESLITNNSLKKIGTPSFGLGTVGALFPSPQISFPHKDLPENISDEIIKSNSWIAEDRCKNDSIPVWLTYSGTYGFEIFSRYFSEETFLPIDLTSKLLVCNDSGIMSLGSFKNKELPNFIMECELVPTKQNSLEIKAFFNGIGAFPEFSEDLGGVETSQSLIIGGEDLDILGIDLVYYNNYQLTGKPAKERLKYRDVLVNKMKKAMPFKEYATVVGDKTDFIKGRDDSDIVILKNLDSEYRLGVRNKDCQVRIRLINYNAKHLD